MILKALLILLLLGVVSYRVAEGKPSRGLHFDTTIHEFQNERTCWNGEPCKTEFQTEFRCRCPRWHWCRGPGRYYHAYCNISAFGHIWLQPGGLGKEDFLENIKPYRNRY